MYTLSFINGFKGKILIKFGNYFKNLKTAEYHILSNYTYLRLENKNK